VIFARDHVCEEIPMPSSVLLVGCCEVDYLGLHRLTEGTDIEIAVNAPTASSALHQLSQQAYDVIVVDTEMGSDVLMNLVPSIRAAHPDPVILLISTQDNPVLCWRLSNLGVHGCFLRSDASESILQRLRDAAAKQGGWSRDELRRLSIAGNSMESVDEGRVALTHREKEVLQQLILGSTNKEIAQSLGVSFETVKEHVQNILFKVGVMDRSQAAIWAVLRQAV
jgi:DNA-binding NarL/FixJ family response regulator